MRENEVLTKNKHDLTINFKNSNNRADNWHNAYKELEHKKNDEIECLADEINLCSQKEKESLGKCIHFEKANNDLVEQNRLARREIDTNKQEFENMVKVMEDLESKVNLFNTKEENLNTFAKECKKTLEESLLEKDRAVLKEETLIRQIDKLGNENKDIKNDLINRNDKLVTSLKSKHKSMIDMKNNEIGNLQDSNAHLLSEKER